MWRTLLMRVPLDRKLNTFLKSAGKKFSDLRISVRLTLFYLIVLIASMALSNILYQQIYYNIALKKVSDVSIQTLYSLKANLNLMINNVNNYSKMILSDNDLQYLLRSGNIYSDLNAQGRVSTYLYKLIQEEPAILSVYVFDNSGNEYNVSNQTAFRFLPDNIKKADWYDTAVNGKGTYILRLNGGGAFEHTTADNFISMIRLVRDINTTEPIGILIINISETAFKDSFSYIVNNYTTGINILDENNESIVRFSDISQDETGGLVKGFGNMESGFRIETLNNYEYLVSYLREDRYNWKIMSMMPVKELSNETATPGIIGFAIILINSFILFVGSIFTSRMITIPIKKLLKSMKSVEKGELKEVDIRAGDNEIGKLRDGYNIMINEIKELIKRVIEEQRVKRKAELDVLQAQIKPHFLYNTLDSINSLALSGKTDDLCNIVDALGNYYRLSLSKGKEIVTIGEEIELVKNYLKIQQTRYGDMFSASFVLDGSCGSCKILKLVLQPLVENALYHGIRAKGESGTITIGSSRKEGHILLTVEDDGVGMAEEDIRRVLDNGARNVDSSFGLRGTIERLRIFYGIEDVMTIESRKGYGTRITISIPVPEKGEDEAHG